MPFTQFKLHPDLLRGLKDLGFPRPTPIQADAIPPALEGRDVLACAMTGSGKTVAFLLPILHQLINKPRGTTRALIITPTRELAAQILEDVTDLAVHTPVSAAAVFGGVGMGPQEHAFRNGVDIIVGTPGRLLDLFRAPMPPPIAELTREMLHDPATINLERRSTPATGITQAIYPVAQPVKAALLLKLLQSAEVQDALVFTRTKHRADRLAKYLAGHKVSVERIHGNRSQAQRTQALEGFKSGRYQVLVATDIAARGIVVAALGHVINFDVPAQPEDYIHRVGRTARAELTGSAYTLVAPEEEADVRAI